MDGARKMSSMSPPLHCIRFSLIKSSSVDVVDSDDRSPVLFYFILMEGTSTVLTDIVERISTCDLCLLS